MPVFWLLASEPARYNRMKAKQLLNPFFLYRNRERIIPSLVDRRLRLARWRQLRRFENRHAGQRCFIIGNGPSLTIADLEMLQAETTFAANKIYLAFDKTAWRPTYYVVEDDHMIAQHADEIKQLTGFPKFINGEWRHLFRGDSRAIFYPRDHASRDQFPMFSANPYEVLFCGYMVTYISLQLAFFMGFERVYLVGVDFHYSGYEKGGGTAQAREDYHNHFTSNYFKPGELMSRPQLDRAKRAMVCAREVFESHQRTIMNATRGGKLEVFERVSLGEVLKESR